MKRILLIFVLCVATAARCFCADWLLIYNDDKYVSAYIDLQSIKRDGELVYVWVKRVYHGEVRKEYIQDKVRLYKKTLKAPELSYYLDKIIHFEYELSYEAYDCGSQSIKPMENIFYAKDGSVIDHHNFEDASRFARLAPDSQGMITLDAVCFKTTFIVDGKKYSIPIEKVKGFLEKYPNAIMDEEN